MTQIVTICDRVGDAEVKREWGDDKIKEKNYLLAVCERVVKSGSKVACQKVLQSVEASSAAVSSSV